MMPLKSSFIDLTTDEVDAPVPSMDLSAGTDEIIIDTNKLELVEQNKFIIKERFNVTVSKGMTSFDGNQWLDFLGEESQRKKAKDYVKTLCNPSETVTMPIPPDLKSLLTNPAIRQRLEETTQAVLVFTRNNEVIIQGLDSLSVTLALSAVEDIIHKHVNPMQKSPLKSPDSSTRLDRELRRLSSEDRSSILNDDYSHYNDAVKRTIISWMRDEGDTDSVATGVKEVDLKAVKKTSKARKETEPMNFTGEKDFKFDFSLPAPPNIDKIHNDPTLRPKMLEQQIGLTHHLADYMEQRSRDHEEEASIHDREALIRKNEGRQELLREAYKKREEEKLQHDGGAHAMVTDSVKPKKNDQKSLAESLTEIALEERGIDNDDGAIVIMDTLDDFSIPVISRNKQKRIHASPQNREAKKTIRSQRRKTPSPPGSKRMPRWDQPGTSSAARNKSPSPPQISRHPPQAGPPLFFVPRSNVPRVMQSQPMQSRPPAPLRYIVIDGSNIALAHGNHRVFSCKGIQICIDFFRRRGHTEVTAFVPQWRTRAPSREKPISQQHLLEELREQGTLVFTPARRVPNKNIVCYDDKFIVRLAHETDGIMVSNDNYRDLWEEKPEWRDTIANRLVGYSFVGDIFMLPDDPLGRSGPCLDDFLRKPAPGRNRNHSQPLPQASVSAHGGPPQRYPVPAKQQYQIPQTGNPNRAKSQPIAQTGNPNRAKSQPIAQTGNPNRARSQPIAQTGNPNRAKSQPIVQAPHLDERLALRNDLSSIFIGNEEIVKKVLDANPEINNPAQLSELILQAMENLTTFN